MIRFLPTCLIKYWERINNNYIQFGYKLLLIKYNDFYLEDGNYY